LTTLIGTRGLGPGGSGGVLSGGREIPEGLAVGQPRLANLFRGMGKVWEAVGVTLPNQPIPLPAEGLGGHLGL